MPLALGGKPVSYWVHSVITIGLMVFFGFLPPIGDITPMGMKVLGIFLGCLWGWIFVEMIWPSVIGLVFFGLSGYTTISGVFGTAMDAQVMQCFMCFLVAGLFDCFGVTSYLASKMLSNKMMLGKPWVIATVLFLTVGVISVLSSTIAAIFLMWAIITKIADEVGCEKGDKFIAFLIAGCVYSGFTSAMILPFKATTVTFMSFVQGTMDIQIPVVPYILFMLFYYIVSLVVYLLFGKVLLRLDTSKFKSEKDLFEDLRGKKANKLEKIGLGFIGIFIGVLLWPSIFPAEWAITQIFSQLGLIGVIAVLITIGALMHDEKGKPIAPISKLMGHIGWDVIWLLMATFPVAAAMRSADCGIMDTISKSTMPLISNMSISIIIIAVMIIIAVLTQVTHNVVLGIMFMPFVCQIVANMGGNPIVAWWGMFMALMSAFGTPAASMNAAMVFGHANVRESKMGYVYGFGYAIIMNLIAIVFLPIANMIF